MHKHKVFMQSGALCCISANYFDVECHCREGKATFKWLTRIGEKNNDRNPQDRFYIYYINIFRNFYSTHSLLCLERGGEKVCTAIYWYGQIDSKNALVQSQYLALFLFCMTYFAWKHRRIKILRAQREHICAMSKAVNRKATIASTWKMFLRWRRSCIEIARGYSKRISSPPAAAGPYKTFYILMGSGKYAKKRILGEAYTATRRCVVRIADTHLSSLCLRGIVPPLTFARRRVRRRNIHFIPASRKVCTASNQIWSFQTDLHTIVASACPSLTRPSISLRRLLSIQRKESLLSIISTIISTF